MRIRSQLFVCLLYLTGASFPSYAPDDIGRYISGIPTTSDGRWLVFDSRKNSRLNLTLKFGLETTLQVESRASVNLAVRSHIFLELLGVLHVPSYPMLVRQEWYTQQADETTPWRPAFLSPAVKNPTMDYSNGADLELDQFIELAKIHLVAWLYESNLPRVADVHGHLVATQFENMTVDRLAPHRPPERAGLEYYFAKSGEMGRSPFPMTDWSRRIRSETDRERVIKKMDLFVSRAEMLATSELLHPLFTPVSGMIRIEHPNRHAANLAYVLSQKISGLRTAWNEFVRSQNVAEGGLRSCLLPNESKAQVGRPIVNVNLFSGDSEILNYDDQGELDNYAKEMLLRFFFASDLDALAMWKRWMSYSESAVDPIPAIRHAAQKIDQTYHIVSPEVPSTALAVRRAAERLPQPFLNRTGPTTMVVVSPNDVESKLILNISQSFSSEVRLTVAETKRRRGERIPMPEFRSIIVNAPSEGIERVVFVEQLPVNWAEAVAIVAGVKSVKAELMDHHGDQWGSHWSSRSVACQFFERINYAPSFSDLLIALWDVGGLHGSSMIGITREELRKYLIYTNRWEEIAGTLEQLGLPIDEPSARHVVYDIDSSAIASPGSLWFPLAYHQYPRITNAFFANRRTVAFRGEAAAVTHLVRALQHHDNSDLFTDWYYSGDINGAMLWQGDIQLAHHVPHRQAAIQFAKETIKGVFPSRCWERIVWRKSFGYGLPPRQIR